MKIVSIGQSIVNYKKAIEQISANSVIKELISSVQQTNDARSESGYGNLKKEGIGIKIDVYV